MPTAATTKLSTDIGDIWEDIHKNKPLVNQELFDFTLANLNAGVDQVFPGLKYTDKDFKLVQSFKRSNSKFAAYKTAWQTEELRTSKKKDAPAIDQKYNTIYLKAEKSYVVNSARSAKNWQNYEADADLYPYLEYMPSVSAEPRQDHKKFYGVILPLNDPFWNTWLPPNDWGCKCWVKQRKSDAKSKKLDTQDVKKPPAMMRQNPAKTGEIFNDKHPMIAKFNKEKSASKINELLRWQIAGFTGRDISEILDLQASKSGGAVFTTSTKVDNPDYDNVLAVSKEFAKDGKLVEITQPIHIKDKDYDLVYGQLKDTIYYGKCPDLKINGVCYEHEGFTSEKNGLNNMLTHGSKQANKLIIEDTGDDDWYFKKRIIDKNKQSKFKIEELWVMSKTGKLRLIK